MKAGTFPAALFGRAVAAIQLLAPLRCRRATYLENAAGELVGIRCGDIRIVGSYNLLENLCCRLAADGDDYSLQVRWGDRSAAVLVASVRGVAMRHHADGATAVQPKCREGPKAGAA